MEPTGMRSSARNALEVIQKLSSDKQQSTLIHNFGNPLGIPFLSYTVLSVGLCHARKCRYKEFGMRRKGMICELLMDVCMRNLWQKAERGKNAGTNSCTRFPQASCFKKILMCPRNMGAHVQHGTRRTKGMI
jgi:hypothetical protein